MNATQPQMSRYLSLWHARGADTLSFAVKPAHVFTPSSGQAQMEQLAADVRADLNTNGLRPIVFHQMSAGAYMYGQLLRSLQGDGTTPDVRADPDDVLLRCVTGQVFDSTPISIEDIARGTAKLFGDGAVREAVLGGAASAYLAATKNTAGVHFRAANAAFHDNPIASPSLWLYSKADATLDVADCSRVAGLWRSRHDVEVLEGVWSDAKHIQLLRNDPDKYNAEIDRFLARTKALSLPTDEAAYMPAEREPLEASA